MRLGGHFCGLTLGRQLWTGSDGERPLWCIPGTHWLVHGGGRPWIGENVRVSLSLVAFPVPSSHICFFFSSLGVFFSLSNCFFSFVVVNHARRLLHRERGALWAMGDAPHYSLGHEPLSGARKGRSSADGLRVDEGRVPHLHRVAHLPHCRPNHHCLSHIW